MAGPVLVDDSGDEAGADDEGSDAEGASHGSASDIPDERKWLVASLTSSFLFSDMRHRWLVRVASLMSRAELSAGTEIVRQGDEVGDADCMYVVGEGLVDVVIFGTLDELQRILEGNPEAELVADGGDPPQYCLRFSRGKGTILGDSGHGVHQSPERVNGRTHR